MNLLIVFIALIILCIVPIIIVIVINSRRNTSLPKPGTQNPLIPSSLKFAGIRVTMKSKFPKIAAAHKVVTTFPSAPSLPMDYVLPSPYLPTACNCETDPDAASKLEQLRAPVNNFEDWIDTMNDAIVWGSDTESANASNVLLTGIEQETSRGALTGDLNDQGRLERMNLLLKLATIAMRSDKSVSSTVQSWLTKVVNESKDMFLSRKNNLRIWCILNMTITGLALNDAVLTNAASDAWDYTCNNYISDTGEMPSEAARGSRAVKYHEYACDPLVTSAYWLHKDHSRLHALVDYVLGLDRTQLPTRMQWIVLYNTQFGFSRLKNKAIAQKEFDALSVNPKSPCSMGGNVYWQIP